MFIGKPVHYYDSKGTKHDATVTALVGAGPSGKKILDLSHDGGEAKSVPHGDDHDGKGFWLLTNEEPPKAAGKKKAGK